MTRKDNGYQERTPFSKWITKVLDDGYNFDVENLDYIRFHYREGWLITIEEKRFGAHPTKAQNDTHNIIAQMLAFASGEMFSTMRGLRPIEYRGHYIISFENTTPADSRWVRINDKKYDNVCVVVTNLLKTGYDVVD